MGIRHVDFIIKKALELNKKDIRTIILVDFYPYKLSQKELEDLKKILEGIDIYERDGKIIIEGIHKKTAKNWIFKRPLLIMFRLSEDNYLLGMELHT